MNSLLPFAREMLSQYGEFFPFGGAMQTSGKIEHIGGYEGNERPASLELIRIIKQGFILGAQAGNYKATALVYDVRVILPSTGEKSDAIAVSLNHKDDYSIIVLLPYKLNGRELVVGVPFAQKGESDIFPAK